VEGEWGGGVGVFLRVWVFALVVGGGRVGGGGGGGGGGEGGGGVGVRCSRRVVVCFVVGVWGN